MVHILLFKQETVCSRLSISLIHTWCPSEMLGLIIYNTFIIYLLPLLKIVSHFGIQFYFYADETQLYVSKNPTPMFPLLSPPPAYKPSPLGWQSIRSN